MCSEIWKEKKKTTHTYTPADFITDNKIPSAVNLSQSIKNQ